MGLLIPPPSNRMRHHRHCRIKVARNVNQQLLLRRERVREPTQRPKSHTPPTSQWRPSQQKQPRLSAKEQRPSVGKEKAASSCNEWTGRVIQWIKAVQRCWWWNQGTMMQTPTWPRRLTRLEALYGSASTTAQSTVCSSHRDTTNHPAESPTPENYPHRCPLAKSILQMISKSSTTTTTTSKAHPPMATSTTRYS